MLWLLAGAALLGLFLMSLRAFDRAPISSLQTLLPWALAPALSLRVSENSQN